MGDTEEKLIAKLQRVLGKHLNQSDVDFLHCLKRSDVVNEAVAYLEDWEPDESLAPTQTTFWSRAFRLSDGSLCVDDRAFDSYDEARAATTNIYDLVVRRSSTPWEVVSVS